MPRTPRYDCRYFLDLLERCQKRLPHLDRPGLLG
jgi:hypothetical protein